MMRSLLLVAFVAGLSLRGVAEDSTLESTSSPESVTSKALTLEREVVKTRRSIPSGEAEVRVTRSDLHGPQHWKLWFSGDRLRMEQFDSQGESVKKIVRASGQILHRGVGIKDKTGEQLLSAPEVHPDDWNGTMLFDLRKLGLVPVPTGVLHSIDEWEYPVSDPSCERLSMEAVELDAREVTKIVMKASDGDLTSLWIDEHRGPSLVRLEHEAHPKGKRYLDTLIVDVAEVDGTWFPQKVVHKRQVGFRFLPDETTVLEKVRLNHEIPDSMFTLDSVGAKPGDHVNVYPRPAGGLQMWDGSQLISRKPPPRPFVPVDFRRSPRFWFVMGNVGVAIAFLMYHFFRKRTNGDNL